MAVLSVGLVTFAVGGCLVRPWRTPAWVFPLVAALGAMLFADISVDAARDAVEPLHEPILFLLFAVPLAALLDELGVFEAASHLIGSRAACGGMWVLSAACVVVLNLDAAVVLVTPLAVKVARRWGLDPVALAFQPALLACLASSALPASNLTNLIAQSDRDLGPVELLHRLGPATLAASAVGYLGWRVAFRNRPLTASAHPYERVLPRRPLVIGAAVLVALLVGFVPLGAIGVPAWTVVAVVDVALVILARHVPWRTIPWGTAVVVAGLAVAVHAMATHTSIAEWVTVDGAWTQTIVSAGAANLMNNLPAFLLPLDHVTGGEHLAAHLLGVNAGPTLLVTGSLSGLLWLETAQRAHLGVNWRSYLRVGLIAGLPALLASATVMVLTP